MYLINKLVLIIFLSAIVLGEQFDNSVTYNLYIDRDNVYAGEVFTVSSDVKIEQGFHIYSSHPDLTLSPSYFEWVDTSLFSQIGVMVEPPPRIKFDPIFDMDVGIHNNDVILSQNIQLDEGVRPGTYTLEGTFIFQVCDATKCIPHWDDFALTLTVDEGDSQDKYVYNINTEYLSLGGKESQDTTDATAHKPQEKESLLTFFIMAFIAGLAALITPCVFPMIPMTVAFFTGGSKDRTAKSDALSKAVLFGFSIIIIYTIVGIGVSLLFGADVANDLATSAIANIIFFVIFLVFAISFLGAFDIVIPSAFVNRMNKNANKGGVIGVFFMAFTLVLVSFSCTGPIVGTVLIESAQGALLKPTIGMLGFSLAFAIPFTLFAAFPEWMQSLPKSGGWLNSVKVVLGFLELALSLKFLSVADQAYHWGLLDRDVYLACWVVIFFLLGVYLLGKLRLPHDSPVESISVSRLLMAVVTFSFVLYMIPGLFGAPLKALSGFLPPMTSQDFDLNRLVREQTWGTEYDSPQDQNFPNSPLYSDFLHLPHGLQGFFDYNEALAYAQEVNKPLFIDFTGHGCVNCRKMEEYVWSDPEVLKRMKNDFVVVALYVDDKSKLPEEKWVTSKFDGKVKKTLGKQNFNFQIERFNSNAQPYYVLLGNNEDLLVDPRAYDLDINEFINFLDTGKNNF